MEIRAVPTLSRYRIPPLPSSGLLATCVTLLFLLSPTASLDAQEASGLLAHWLFDEEEGTDIFDLSGNDNGAEILAPEHVERVVDALAGPALWLWPGEEKPASNPLVGRGYVESGGLAGQLPGPAVSVSAWIRPESFPEYAPVITKVTDTDGWNDGFGVYANPGGGLSVFVNGYDGVSLSGVHNARTGEWAHVCLTFNGEESVFYVNGLPRSSAAMEDDGLTVNNAPVRVGTLVGRWSSDIWAWHGAIADVRVYGEALPADEVLSIFAEAPAAQAVDSLGLGFPDLWALSYGLDPLDPSLAGQAPSGDGLTNLQKHRLGMNPLKAAAASPVPLLRVHTPLEK